MKLWRGSAFAISSHTKLRRDSAFSAKRKEA
jgi:hypothetical protein